MSETSIIASPIADYSRSLNKWEKSDVGGVNNFGQMWRVGRGDGGVHCVPESCLSSGDGLRKPVPDFNILSDAQMITNSTTI